MRFAVLALLLSACAEPTPSASQPKGAPFDLSPQPAFTARALERLEVSSYMYLRTERGWVASLKKDVEIGSVVKIKPIGSKSSFHSRRLNRTFAPLTFAVVSQ